MVKVNKRVFAIFAIFCIWLSGNSVKAMAEEKVYRICGDNKTETSIEASKYLWKDSYNVIIASSEDYADALCAVPLSKKLNAPILLVNNNGLSSNVESEIKRLEARKIIIVGGKGIISGETEEKLKHFGEVIRIWGEDRYETSLNIAKYMGSNKNIILTTGSNYADSLSVGPIAGQANMPILLTKKDEISTQAVEYIKNSKPSKIFIIGGEGVISNEIQQKLPISERIAGKDRYDTNEALIERFYQSFNFNNVCLVSDVDFNDMLIASMVAANTSSPMVLVNNSLEQLNDVLIEKICPSTKFNLFGSEEKISKDIINNIFMRYSLLDVKGKEYGKEDIKDNSVLIKAENIKLKEAKIEDNLYVEAGNFTLDSTRVKGDVLCNLGKEEAFTINKSKLYNLKIQTANNNLINFKDSEAANIFIEGIDEDGFVKLIGSEDFRIISTIVKGNVKLENVKGDFGNITVLNDGIKKKIIKLKGDYDKPIYIQGNTTIKIDQNSKVSKLRLVTSEEKTSVRIEGNVDVVTFINPGFVELSSKANIKRIEAVLGSSGTVNVPEGSMVREVTDNVRVITTGVLPYVIIEPKALPTDELK